MWSIECSEIIKLITPGSLFTKAIHRAIRPSGGGARAHPVFGKEEIFIVMISFLLLFPYFPPRGCVPASSGRMGRITFTNTPGCVKADDNDNFAPPSYGRVPNWGEEMKNWTGSREELENPSRRVQDRLKEGVIKLLTEFPERESWQVARYVREKMVEERRQILWCTCPPWGCGTVVRDRWLFSTGQKHFTSRGNERVTARECWFPRDVE